MVECTKFLGVWIDHKLNWRKHVNMVILKVKHNINLIRQGHKFLDIRSKCIIYFVHIHSHINYCLSVWGNMVNQQQLVRLDKLLTKCKQLVAGNNDQ